MTRNIVTTKFKKKCVTKKCDESAKLSLCSLKPGVLLYSVLDLLIIDITKFPDRTSLSFALFGKKYGESFHSPFSDKRSGTERELSLPGLSICVFKLFNSSPTTSTFTVVSV